MKFLLLVGTVTNCGTLTEFAGQSDLKRRLREFRQLPGIPGVHELTGHQFLCAVIDRTYNRSGLTVGAVYDRASRECPVNSWTLH